MKKQFPTANIPIGYFISTPLTQTLLITKYNCFLNKCSSKPHDRTENHSKTVHAVVHPDFFFTEF
jgi:hypothetical protein